MLAKLEFRTLDVSAPDIDGAADWIDHRLMSGVVETSMTPAEFYGESARGLHINMDSLTIDMTAGAHADRRFVNLFATLARAGSSPI